MNHFFLLPNDSIAGIFYSAMLLFFIPLLYYYKKLRGLFFLVALLLLVLLFFSYSRAGWLGLAAGLIYLSIVHERKRWKAILLVSILSFLLLFIALLCFKPGSTQGRLHIYSISVKILQDNWRTGTGIAKLRAIFNEYQSEYFSRSNINSKKALLADNTFYAFNDYLQWVIETGIAGFIVMILAFYLLFRRTRLIYKLEGQKTIIISTTASLICIGVAALFSYPLQVIPIQAMALFCTSIIIFYPVKNKTGKVNNIINASVKSIFLLLVIFFIISSARTLQRKLAAKSIFKLSMAGYKKEAIEGYETLSKKYPKHGDIMYLYAEQLYYSNRLPEALSAINKARKYYVDNKVYGLKAKIEDESGQKKEAEASYLRAIYMVPNRMASRFDLLNFYLSQKDTLKAIYWANSILNMPVKVPSGRTEIMLNETGEIFQKIKK